MIASSQSSKPLRNSRQGEVRSTTQCQRHPISCNRIRHSTHRRWLAIRATPGSSRSSVRRRPDRLGRHITLQQRTLACLSLRSPRARSEQLRWLM